MRKRNLFAIFLCVILMISTFAGCGKDKIQLTPEQEAGIDKFIEHRDEWDEYVDFVDRVSANRLHVAEVNTKNGKTYTFITVGYFKGDAFVARGYVASSSKFAYIDMAHKDWLSDCVTIDLEGMSDEELREVLLESYIAYLSKEEK